MRHSLIAAIAAAALALAAIPAPARANDAEDLARVLAGILTFAVIARAIQEEARADPAPASRGHSGNRPRHKVLPAECLRELRIGDTSRRVAGDRCLRAEGVRTQRLPERCEIRLSTANAVHTGYGARCLRREGYVFD